MNAWLEAAGLALLAASFAPACVQGWRVERAVRFVGRHRAACVSASRAHSPAPPRRILLIGDSTGVGIGCVDVARESIEAQLTAGWPDAAIVNRSANGARIGDLVRSLAEPQTGACVDGDGAVFDVAVLQVGGNDAMSFAPIEFVASEADLLMRSLRGVARCIVWAGPPNVGLAPLFVPPFSWWMSARARRLNEAFRAAAGRHGADYIDFFREAPHDPFSSDAHRFFAADGIHPSPAAYAYCWRHMRPAVARALADVTSVSTARVDRDTANFFKR